jgi:uncharacterized protein YdaU (DUF1376 family)
MSKSPSFQFYAQDFLTGTMYLTNEEIGVYIKMLAKQWTDGKIPKKRLGFLVGFEWDNLSDELKLKFVDHGDFILNERLEIEREKKNNFLKKQRLNGKKGGRPSKKQEQKNPNKIQPITQKNPLEEEKEIEDEIEVEVETEIYPSFDDFWMEYDKKVGKKDNIKKKWDRLDYETKEKIMQYLPYYKKAQPDKQFRKNPETFLNNESWNDELIVKKTNLGAMETILFK